MTVERPILSLGHQPHPQSSIAGAHQTELPPEGAIPWGRPYLVQQERYYDVLVPEALEVMHGIADGAAAELSASAFPRELSHFHNILMIKQLFRSDGEAAGLFDGGIGIDRR